MDSSSRIKEEIVVEIGEEPVSPYGRVFHTKKINCCIIATVGCKTSIDVPLFKLGLQDTLVKHPRFSSLLVKDDKRGGDMKWCRTNVNIENHVINPNLNPSMDSPDQFVEDYITDLTKITMDPNKPLWECHILNLQTSHAKGIVVFKVHHSIGDGMSLISLLLACSRKTCDQNSLPTIPMKKRPSSKRSSGIFRWFLSFVVGIMYTLVDVVLFAATLILKDHNLIKRDQGGVEFITKRLVHRVLSLDDVKLVKNAMNTTINDVVLGVTQAGLSRYLERLHGSEDEKAGYGGEIKKRKKFLESIRLRALLFVNIRPATGIEELAKMMEKEGKVKWGNKIGYMIIPFNVNREEDPLNYIHKAKAVVDRKKLSFEPLFTFLLNHFLLNFFGLKAAVGILYKALSNTTLAFSNVSGPQEEISLFGHPLSYIAPTIYGIPQTLMIHWQSCGTTMTVSLAVDEDVIPNPHQLCDDIKDSLQLIKQQCSFLKKLNN